jgi:hypothetical protein
MVFTGIFRRERMVRDSDPKQAPELLATVDSVEKLFFVCQQAIFP